MRQVSYEKEYLCQNKDMHFLKLVPGLCHEESMHVRGKALVCTSCNTVPIPDLHAFLETYPNVMDASVLAQAYWEWQHDDTIPVPIVVLNIDGILPKRINHQSLAKVRASIALLKALNAPFTDQASLERPTDDSFLTNHLLENTTDNEVLNQLLQYMHTTMESIKDTNKLDFYFDHLVPHVKKCDASSLLPPVPEFAHPLQELLEHMHRSRVIRDRWSQYSLSFDLFHVLVNAHVCSGDMDVVGNWVLDFLARVCRGEFFWKRYPSCPLVQNVQKLLKGKREFYYVLRQMERGEGIESLSENYPKYMRLDQLVRDKVPDSWPLFPSIVFQDHKDHLAFAIAMTVVVTAMDPKTGRVAKGTYAKARQLHTLMRTLIEQVQTFDNGGGVWTIDYFKMFLAVNPDIEKHMAEMSRLVFET